MNETYKIKFLPDEIEVEVSRSTNLNKAAKQAGIEIVTPCGGRASCHGCKVSLVSGKVAGVTASDGAHLSCSTFPRSSLEVYVPESSRKIDSDYIPDIEIIDVRPDPPSLENYSDDDPLRFTAVGMAIDFGNATVSGRLYNLFTGATLGMTFRANPLDSFGETDRERFIEGFEKGRIDELNYASVRIIDQFARELTRTADVEQTDIAEITFACSSVTKSILTGNPESGGAMGIVSIGLESLGIESRPGASLRFLPAINLPSGNEIISAILSCEIHSSASLTMLINIGSQVSVVLGNSDNLSMSEIETDGTFLRGIKPFGMRPVAGAIEQVVIGEKFLLNTIGSGNSKGISGAGYFNIVAELKNRGLIDDSGNFIFTSVEEYLPYSLSRRFRDLDENPRFILWSGNKSEISINQLEIRQVIGATKKIRALIDFVLMKNKTDFADLERVIFTGAFGKAVRVSDLILMNLIPDCDPDIVEFHPNASLDGAVKSLIAREENDKLDKIIRLIRLIPFD